MSMLTLLLLSVSLAPQQAQTTWKDQLQAAARQAVGDQRITGRNAPPVTKAYTEDWQVINDLLVARKQAVELSKQKVAQGNARGAVDPLVAYLERNPSDESMRIMIADMLFDQKDWGRGYVVLAPEVAAGSPEFVYRASLFSAKRGEVYAGQKEYLVSELVAMSSAFKSDLGPAMPSGSASSDIVLLSMLVIGVAEAGHGGLHQDDVERYLFAALKLDPGNPYAAYTLGRSFLIANRNLECIAALEIGNARATGRMKKSIDEMLRKAKKAQSVPPQRNGIGGG